MKSRNLMSFALSRKGQFIYAYGDQHEPALQAKDILSKNYSLCQVGAGFVFVPIQIIRQQIKELEENEGMLSSDCVMTPYPVSPSSLEYPHTLLLDFFKYEKDEYLNDRIVFTTHNTGSHTRFYSKEEAEQILGVVTLVKVDFYGEWESYYVSEASRLIAETFKDQAWCVRILGLIAK